MREKAIIWVLEDLKTDERMFRRILGESHELAFFDNWGAFFEAFQRVSIQDREDPVPDMVIADLTLSDGHFNDFTEELRSVLQAVPFLIASVEGQEDQISSCLEAGAFHYIVKRHAMEMAGELRGKVSFIWSKVKAHGRVATMGFRRNRFGVIADFSDLTLKELGIVLLLMDAEDAGRELSRDELLALVWAGAAVSPSTVGTHMSHLREKIGKRGWRLVYGERGWRLLRDRPDEKKE